MPGPCRSRRASTCSPTGIRTPVGVKVFGTDLAEMEKLARQIEAVLRTVPGTTSAYRRTRDRRLLPQHRSRPRAARPLRPDGRRRAGRDRDGARRRAGDHHGRRPRALHRQHPLSARLPQRPAGDRHAGADPDGRRRHRAARPGRQGEPGARGRPASAPRTRSSRSTSIVDLRDRDLGGYVADAQKAVAGAGQVPARLLRHLERPVRIPGARQGAPADRRADHGADHLPAALSQLPPRDRDPDRHAVGAVRAGRRPVADVVARLQPVGRGRGRLHRARRRRRRDRRGDADLSRPRAMPNCRRERASGRAAVHARRSLRRDHEPARSSACARR